MSKLYSLGVMTGTSCDGADLALVCLTKKGGRWSERLVQTATQDFPKSLRSELRNAQRGKLNIPEAADLARRYSEWIAKLCKSRLKAWKISKDRTLISVHGQTVWHAPKKKGAGFSVQLLDASVISFVTECTVAAAFRQPDLARGGQGAPLVPYYHWLRAVSAGYADVMPFAIHNIGGIANLTYITKSMDDLIAFDTGPGNALMDMATEKMSRGRKKFDDGGKIAGRALKKIDWAAIDRLGRESYFQLRPPKSTGRELFNESFLKKIPGRGDEQVANATAFTAHTMAKAYADFIVKGRNKLNGVFVAGGGARNKSLLTLFSRELARLTGLEIPVSTLPESFAPPQYLEAMAFARLGFEAVQGKIVSVAAITGASENAIGAGIFVGKNYGRLLKLLDIT